jgi:YD repeat-containing protein
VPGNANGYLYTSYNYDSPKADSATTGTGSSSIHAVSMPCNYKGTLTAQTRDFVYQSTTYGTSLVLPALWLASATNPENGTVIYTYNADGTLATKQDANGNIVNYKYDIYGRLTVNEAGSTLHVVFR